MLLSRFAFLRLNFIAKLCLIACSAASLGLSGLELISNDVAAQSIRIVDCQGKTRAFRKHTTPTDSSIRVDVIDSLGQQVTNAEVILVNAAGKVIKAAVVDGRAEFGQISPGLWMISSPNQGIFFTQIALSDFVVAPFWQSAGATVAQVAEVALFVGVVAGAVIAIDEASNGNSGGSSENGIGPPPETCMTCNPDLAAPSIPDFE